VSKIYTFLTTAGSVFSVLGAIFGVVRSFCPNKKQEEIFAKFRILERQLGGISDDIRDLESKAR